MELRYIVENGILHVELPDGSTCDASDIDIRESWEEYMESVSS